MEKNTRLDGTWENGAFKLTIKRDKYVSFYNGFRYGKGTIMYDNENFTLASTHAYWLFFLQQPFVETVSGKYIFVDNATTVSNIEGRYNAQNGIWRCRKTRKIMIIL
jgi:hypothetical protein